MKKQECEYYPCHFAGQDCELCYCPFYPCKEEAFGGKWKIGRRGNEVWSCKECRIVHEEKIVRKIKERRINDIKQLKELAKTLRFL